MNTKQVAPAPALALKWSEAMDEFRTAFDELHASHSLPDRRGSVCNNEELLDAELDRAQALIDQRRAQQLRLFSAKAVLEALRAQEAHTAYHEWLQEVYA